MPRFSAVHTPSASTSAFDTLEGATPPYGDPEVKALQAAVRTVDLSGVSTSSARAQLIMAQLNTLALAGGGVLQLPPGTWEVDTIKIPSNCGLRGANTGATKLVRVANVPIIDVVGTHPSTTTTSFCEKWSLADLTLIGSHNATTPQLTPLLRAYYSRLGRCNNVNFEWNDGPAIDSTEWWDSIFVNCRFNGVAMASTSAPAVCVRSSTGAASGFGHSADNSNNIHFDFCTFEGNSNGDLGYFGYSGGMGYSNKNRVRGCKFEVGGGHIGTSHRIQMNYASYIVLEAVEFTIWNTDGDAKLGASQLADSVLKIDNSQSIFIRTLRCETGHTALPYGTIDSVIKISASTGVIFDGVHVGASTPLVSGIINYGAGVTDLSERNVRFMWESTPGGARAIGAPTYTPQGSDLAPGIAAGIDTGVENIPRWAAVNNSITLPSGVMRLVYVRPTRHTMVTQLLIDMGATVAGATPSLFKMGLFSVDGSGNLSLLGVTTSDTAALNTTFVPVTKPISGAPIQLIAGRQYAIGVLVVTAAAAPTIMGSTPSTAATLTRIPRLTGSVSSQTDIQSSYTAAQVSSTQTLFYAAALP